MTDTSPAPTLRRWSWRDVVLVASLCVNVAVAGIVAAQALRKERTARIMGPAYNELLPRGFVLGLPADRRDSVVLMLRDARRDFRDQRKDLRAAATRVADALAADPYDPAAVQKAVEDYGNEVNGLVEQGTTFALKVFATLGPEERKALAERLRQRAATR